MISSKTIIRILLFLTLMFLVLWLLTALSGSIAYEDLDQEWCELFNDQADLTNTLLDNLEYYESAYEEVTRVEYLNCFEDN